MLKRKTGVETSTETDKPYYKDTRSLCPVCLKVIDARVFEKDGRILIEKECAEHGDFRDTYWSDAKQFKRFLRYQIPGDPIDNPNTESTGNCPLDCGICDKHQTHTILAEMDLTNRCNQRCPICFANAAAAGYLYEPTFEQIKEMLHMLREQKPNPVQTLQFLGGEPTLHPDIIEIIKYAKGIGFNNLMIATNGIKIAQDIGFARKMKEAGMRSIYLQFDGVTPDPYIHARGYDAWPVKKKAVENLKKLRMATALVPTVVKGVNDDQLGAIIDYGVENIITIKTINFQPLSFIGRIDRDELEEKRITITDIMELVEKQTDGKIKKEYWMPIPAFAPMEMLIEKLFKKRLSKSSTHTHCGAGLYIFKKDDSYITLNEFVDVEMVRQICLDELKKDRRLLAGARAKASVVMKLSQAFDFDKAPDYLEWKEFIKTVIMNKMRGFPEALKQNGMFIGCMHFMDPYNFDLDRVERCCIHYATPDLRLIPFCSFNIFHRAEVEKKYSVPLQKTQKP